MEGSDKTKAEDVVQLTCGEIAAIPYGPPITNAKLAGDGGPEKFHAQCENITDMHIPTFNEARNRKFILEASRQAAMARGGRLLTFEEFSKIPLNAVPRHTTRVIAQGDETVYLQSGAYIQNQRNPIKKFKPGKEELYFEEDNILCWGKSTYFNGGTIWLVHDGKKDQFACNRGTIDKLHVDTSKIKLVNSFGYLPNG